MKQKIDISLKFDLWPTKPAFEHEDYSDTQAKLRR